MRNVPALFLLLFAACTTSVPPTPAPSTVPFASPTPTKTGLVYGVTFDDVSRLADLQAVTAKLPTPRAIRLVLDYPEKPQAYQKAVSGLGGLATLLLQPLDSTYVPKCDLACTKKRFTEYLDAFPGDHVWEVGNEVNGEWLGAEDDVASKMLAAFEIAKGRGKKTALTVYVNSDGKNNCWAEKREDLVPWIKRHVPGAMATGLDWVLVSFYEADCPGVHPDWRKVFTELSALFPLSRVGFGEVGSTKGQAAYAQKYYSLRLPDVPAYLGGWFWWYGSEDLLRDPAVLDAIGKEAK